MGQKNPILRPFLKWAGGKRQLLPELMKYKPIGFSKSKNTYYEPFVGGGAFLFELERKKAVINDKNQELINCYKVVRDSVDELIEELRNHDNNDNSEYYYHIRQLDRKSEAEFKSECPIKRAGRIIYLNKTCYNGLFRVNSQGQFNVPYGKYKNPKILDEAVLRAVSKYLNLKGITILNTDFLEAVENAKKGDFIYFDPPYDPVSNTASFTGYDINGFNKEQQKRLKEVFDELHKKGCKIMLSNSKTGFILDLYRGYRVETVKATRNINSKAFKRGKVDEVLVMNYEK